MIRKKQIFQPDKKVNPLIGSLLFIISIILLIITGPLGFVYGLFHSLFTKGFKGVGEYLLKIAISIDQLGNVLMQHLLNLLWIKKAGYKFGNRDETISSVLGRNNKLKTLTGFGKAIDRFLDAIDPSHTLNSIDYYIEPTKDIIDKLAWIHLVDKQILCTRSIGKSIYYLPGGYRESEESDAKTLFREIKEELGVDLEISSMQYIGTFEASADDNKPEVLVRMTCYSAKYQGILQSNPSLDEMVWLNYKDRDRVSEVAKFIFNFLKEKDELA